ncbi:MAG TPA: superoxide dismutase family protein, partial [Kofleriaceae bacterium]|nr:superoxide dismutase family protein [Kofleriaceae bacterium]
MVRYLVLVSFLVACGGKAKPAAPTPPPPMDKEVEPVEDEKPDPKPPAPPPPKVWHAKAELAPVKGSKMKAATIAFSQTEGESVQIVTDTPIDGLKAGKYHLVIHEAASCGPNATKAGAAWSAGAVDLDVAKGASGSVDQSDGDLMLDGEHSVVGHTLVLHDDKKGKPGKAVACGA